jgi:hypothetical protein
MQEVSIGEFRSTREVSACEHLGAGVKIYSYWNNQDAGPTLCDGDEVLHIIRQADGSFNLEIGNLLHRGDLAELEEILFEWASSEGWLTQDNLSSGYKSTKDAFKQVPE